MVHTPKRFSDPLKESSQQKLLYVANGMVSGTLEEYLSKKGFSMTSSLREIDERAGKQDSRVLAHLEAYRIYHEHIRDHIDTISRRLDDYDLVFVDQFVTPHKEEDPRSTELLEARIKTTTGKKQGVSLYSALNSMKDVIRDIERQRQDERPRIYISVGPIVSFGMYDPEQDDIINVVDALAGEPIIDQANEYMHDRGKQGIADSRVSSFMPEEFYMLSPAFYHSKPAKEKAKSLEEEQEAAHLTQYNRYVTAMIWAEILKKTGEKNVYYYGTGSSPSSDIIKKAAEWSGKALAPSYAMENAELPLDGASANSAANKLKGYLTFRNAKGEPVTLGQMFKNKPERFR